MTRRYRLQLIVGWTMTLVLVIWLAVSFNHQQTSSNAISGGVAGAAAGVSH